MADDPTKLAVAETIVLRKFDTDIPRDATPQFMRAHLLEVLVLRAGSNGVPSEVLDRWDAAEENAKPAPQRRPAPTPEDAADNHRRPVDPRRPPSQENR